jgi:hypothetical protein
MKKTLLLTCLIMYAIDAMGQGLYATNDSTYQALVLGAIEDLQKGDCKSCIEKYDLAFVISQRSILSRLRAVACAYECKEDTKWKQHLDFALNKEWSTVENILFDKSNRYSELSKYANSEIYSYAAAFIKDAKIKSGYDEALAKELELIERDDQMLRQKSEEGLSNEDQLKLWQHIEALDSLNQIKIAQIIAKHGYPGKSKVGAQASTAFLVIQHADLAFQEKYFPLLEEAVNKNELDKGSFALLVDRIRVRKGQKQLYGSQLSDKNGDGLFEFDPIEDEVNVNERRKQMGLGTIEEYAKLFGLEYKYVKK